jgi:hypothetical protein
MSGTLDLLDPRLGGDNRHAKPKLHWTNFRNSQQQANQGDDWHRLPGVCDFFLPLSRTDFRPSLLSGYLPCRVLWRWWKSRRERGFFDVDLNHESSDA